MERYNPILNIVVAVGVVAGVCLYFYIIEPKMMRFCSIIAIFGMFMMWMFSPHHDIIKGIRRVPILWFMVMGWPAIGVILMTSSLGILIRLGLSSCVLILGIGIAVLATKTLR